MVLAVWLSGQPAQDLISLGLWEELARPEDAEERLTVKLIGDFGQFVAPASQRGLEAGEKGLQPVVAVKMSYLY